ncbi:MAG: hypothetical protein ABIJ96_14850 [Elusimicrobiota bacterium]
MTSISLLCAFAIALPLAAPLAAQDTVGEALEQELDQKGINDPDVSRAARRQIRKSGISLSAPLKDNVRFSPDSGLQLEAEPLDIPAALLITDAARAYVYKGKPKSKQGFLRTATVPLGQALEPAGTMMYSQLFNDLKTTSRLGDADKTPVHIALEINEYSYRFSGMISPKVTVEVSLRAGLYYRGELLWERTYKSPPVKRTSMSLLPKEDKHSKAASMALLAALKMSADDVANERARLPPVVDEYVRCTQWGPKTGIADEDKALIEIGKLLRDSIGDEFGTVEILSPKGKAFNLGPSMVYKAISVVEDIFKGEYEKAAGTAADGVIGYLVPVAGQYKALLDAAKTAGKAVIENWVRDLELHPAYEKVSDLVEKEVVAGAKRGEPYIPSVWVRGREIYPAMRERERMMYETWKTSDEFFLKFQQDGYHARIRQKYGQDLDDQKIFNRFFYSVIQDQRGFIESNYKRVIEEQMFDQAYKLRRPMITQVCKRLEMLKLRK